MLGRFAEQGVATEYLTMDGSEPTGLTVAVSTPEDRAFFTYLGANRGFAQAFREAADRRRLRARHVHLGFAPAWDTAAELIDAVHANGCTLSVDAGWHEDWLADRRALEVLPKVDLFFPNEREAALMTGCVGSVPMLKRFAEAGFRRVALKMGANGAGVLWDGEIHFGVPPAVTVQDTTGAGDCFDAGFLYAWLKGEPAARSLRVGNICGALSCEAAGGIAGFPSRERLARELEGTE
jgi:sugar/nucleoside kinase (ribokinase family)